MAALTKSRLQAKLDRLERSLAREKKEKARLVSEAKEALERQTATADILKVISNSPTDTQPVFDTIAERAVALCGGEVSVVSRFDGASMQLAALHGITREGVEALRKIYPVRLDAETLTTRAFRSRSVVHLADVLADPWYEQMATAVAAGWRSGLAVPMLGGPEVIGVIFVGRSTAGLFAESQVELLKTFAAQAVIAIENVRLFNETKEALEQQTATGDILRVIAESPTDTQPVFDAVCTNAARLCDAYDALIWRVEGEHLAVAGHYGPIPVVDEPLCLARDVPPGRTAIDRRTIHTLDLAAETAEYPVVSAFARRVGFHTAVSVPLIRADVVIGVITIRRREVRGFSDKQIQLLKLFADQAAIAIESTRLFNETKEALERQTATATPSSDGLRQLGSGFAVQWRIASLASAAQVDGSRSRIIEPGKRDAV